jgi:organic hydroperoxide reductase OsmC/OhrA
MVGGGGVMRACYRKCCPISRLSTVFASVKVPNKRHHLRRRVDEALVPVAKGYSIGYFSSKNMSDGHVEHMYSMKSNWVRDKIVTIEIEGKPDFQVATPPDFWPESPKDIISPEDLFVASALACYGVSLSGVAKRFHGEFKNFHLSGTGTLYKGESGWEFEQITIDAKIIVETEKDHKRMTKAAERAHKYCLVANSMKCPVHLNFEVVIE